MQPNPGNKIKIIITDDHSLYRTGVRNSLENKEDIEIIGEAENGKHLLDQLEHLYPDMIIMGFQMPVMHGLEAMPILRRKHPLLKVIILSMHSDPSIICQFIEAGANSYLTKECGSAEIYDNIQALRTRWFYINDTVKKAIMLKEPVHPSCEKMKYSANEIHIMQLLDKGKSVTEIATIGDLSSRTVEAIIDRLKEKTSSFSVAQVIEFARKNNLLDIQESQIGSKA